VIAIDVGISRGIEAVKVEKRKLINEGKRVFFDPIVKEDDIANFKGGCAQLEVKRIVKDGKEKNTFNILNCKTNLKTSHTTNKRR
jgi:hypothetical protein